MAWVQYPQWIASLFTSRKVLLTSRVIHWVSKVLIKGKSSKELLLFCCLSNSFSFLFRPLGTTYVWVQVSWFLYYLHHHWISADLYRMLLSSQFSFDCYSQTYTNIFYGRFFCNHNYWIWDFDFMQQKNIIDLLLCYNPILWDVLTSNWNWT